MDLGMDSLMAVELQRRLEHSMGCSLRSTLMFDYPTVESLAAYLDARLFSAKEADGPEDDAPAGGRPGLGPIGEQLEEIQDMSDDDVFQRLRK